MAHISQWDNHPYIKDLPHNLECLGGPSEVHSHSYSHTPWKDPSPKKNSDELRKDEKSNGSSTSSFLSQPGGMFSPQPPRNDWYILGSTSHGHSPGSPPSRLAVRRNKCNLASISSRSCAGSSWLRDPYTHKFHTGLKTSDLAPVFVRKRPVTWMAAMMNIDEYRWIYRWI